MATIQTPFQLIDIWDIFDGTENQFQSYERSLHPEVDTFESHNPQLFSLQRNYFLQGVLQSNDKDETAYHEALVHPAMFAHHDPFNVAIIGGGDGASLREILKHKSVDEEEEEEGGFFDLFADENPQSNFSFDVNGKRIELEGFKLASDEGAQSTGVTLWEAAPRLANYIISSSSDNNMVTGKEVLELGAGLGLCGMVTHHLGAKSVDFTDADTITLERLRHKLKKNCVYFLQQKPKTAYFILNRFT